MLCILRRCNIPIAIAVVWISNPITMGPMMYFAYKLGGAVTGQAADLEAMGLIGFLLSQYYFSRQK